MHGFAAPDCPKLALRMLKSVTFTTASLLKSGRRSVVLWKLTLRVLKSLTVIALLKSASPPNCKPISVC